MGKSLARHPLINVTKVPGTEDLPPVPFPKTDDTDKRPLAGVKVVELARVIAAPAAGAALTSLGAEVVKVESPNLPDPNPLQLSLTAGKYTCPLDLTNPEDREHLQKLLEGADVVIQSYRRRSLERKGFGLLDVLAAARKRNKGMIYMDMNCYGPDGTYSERPGYQKCADAASGLSYVFGKAYGFDEGVAVLPSLPISDMESGINGALGILIALRDRAIHGGSYHVDVALTAVNTIQTTPEFGMYQPEIVKKIQEKYQFAPMTPDQHVEDLLFVVVSAWAKAGLFQREDYLSKFAKSPFGKDRIILAPIVRFDNKNASPRWKHSPVPYCYHERATWGQDTD